MTLFQCPVCSKVLTQGNKQYFCSGNHSFDISSRGYVNLLLPNHKGSGDPGDSKEMLQSRRDFLNKGYYSGFSDLLNDILLKEIADADPEKEISILDAGCGEGYYVWRLKNRLAESGNTHNISFYGIDVSKPAIHYAAGRDKKIRFAVASTYHLPFLPGSMDYVICLFAPRDEREFRRILKPSGKLVVAAPGPRHLFSLRTEIYEDPEPIGVKGTAGEGYKLLESANASYNMHLDNNQDIMNLLTMTPYIRHTDVQALESLKKLDVLDTEVDINIMVYESERVS